MSEINEFDCIKYMETTRYRTWETIKNTYKKTLDDGTPINNIAFTPHNYKNHCKGIYKVTSKLLFKGKKYDDFDQDLLLSYNIAVLLHDYSMSQDIDFKRERHQLESIETLKKERKDPNSVLNQLTDEVFDNVCKIIKAHSDVKDENIKTLEKINEEECNAELIVMCAIMRLADELDITSTRINKKQLTTLRGYVEKHKDEESETINKAKESLEHWEFCNYILKLERHSKNAKMIVVSCIEDNITEFGDTPNVCNTLLKKEVEINTKLKEINSILNHRYDEANKYMTSVDSIKFFVNSQELEVYLRNSAKMGFSEKNNPIILDDGIDNKEDISSTDFKNECLSNLLDHNLSILLKNWVVNENILVPGHFRINNSLCARDWISINQILNDNYKINIIINAFYNHIIINNKIDKIDLCLIGLDFNGMILASRLSLLLDCPFVYIIPPHSEDKHSDKDIINDLPKNKKIIFIYDIVATLSTINTYSEQIENCGSEILSIYSIFYRKPIYYGKNDIDTSVSRQPYNLYSLNCDFDIEIFRVSDCKIIKTQSCICLNPIIT